MKFLTLIIVVVAVIASQDTLLTLSKSSSCLKGLVSSFVRAEDCTHLSDQQKTKLAMKMTECLMKQMGRSIPLECSEGSNSCKLQGDAWNTFSTFFAHIDNLCHFYWETLHHQRAQKLIGQLSESSSKAEQVLRNNSQETKKILSMQQQMHSSLNNSIQLQSQMADLINSSANKVINMTQEIETFIERIHDDIDTNYASIRNLLEVISISVDQIVSIQSYIQAQITSVSGILFFLIQFLLVLFFTSFKKYHSARPILLVFLVVQIVVELIAFSFLSSLVNIKYIRYIFIGIMTLNLISNGKSQNNVQNIISNRLSTPRLQRIINRAAERKNEEWAKNMSLSSLLLIASKQNLRRKEDGQGVMKTILSGREQC